MVDGSPDDRTLALCPAYRTKSGVMYQGLAETFLTSRYAKGRKGRIQLILTSPPFPLNRKKRYGNLSGQEYIDWIRGFASGFREMLTPDGSLVIEIGNAWEKGHPVMSTLTVRALLALLDAGPFYLCQQFICHNPARLPSPAQWVNVERIRVKDAYTLIWWMAPSATPKADNRRILKEYSPSMLRLLATQSYNPGKRPSEHCVGSTSFLTDNKGAIPSNVLTIANTSASDDYQRYCRAHNLQPHPARMPIQLAQFFINFLTDPGDLVMDPFAGSNTTGACAERLGRRWVSVEPNEIYISSSYGRFPKSNNGG